MHNSIVVHRVMSENVGEGATNFSFQTVKSLEKMGVIEFITGATEVYREGETTITVYNYRKA